MDDECEKADRTQELRGSAQSMVIAGRVKKQTLYWETPVTESVAFINMRLGFVEDEVGETSAIELLPLHNDYNKSSYTTVLLQYYYYY